MLFTNVFEIMDRALHCVAILAQGLLHTGFVRAGDAVDNEEPAVLGLSTTTRDC